MTEDVDTLGLVLRGVSAPIVMVRDIRPLDQSLYAVTIRTRQGDILTVVVDRQLATTATVAMAAHVVAVLVLTGRIPTQPASP